MNASRRVDSCKRVDHSVLGRSGVSGQIELDPDGDHVLGQEDEEEKVERDECVEFDERAKYVDELFADRAPDFQVLYRLADLRVVLDLEVGRLEHQLF